MDSSEVTYFDQINRGGLWKISPSAENIFVITETIFRENTSKGLEISTPTW